MLIFAFHCVEGPLYIAASEFFSIENVIVWQLTRCFPAAFRRSLRFVSDSSSVFIQQADEEARGGGPTPCSPRFSPRAGPRALYEDDWGRVRFCLIISELIEPNRPCPHKHLGVARKMVVYQDCCGHSYPRTFQNPLKISHKISSPSSRVLCNTSCDVT